MDNYNVPRCNTYTDADPGAEQDGGYDQGRQYARVASIVVDEIPVQDNNAYGYTSRAKIDPEHEEELYAVPHCNHEGATKKQTNGSKPGTRGCCVTMGIISVLFIAALALAAASLALFLILNGYQTCSNYSCISRMPTEIHSDNSSNSEAKHVLNLLQTELTETKRKVFILENKMREYTQNQTQRNQMLDSRITNHTTLLHSLIRANTANESNYADISPSVNNVFNCSTSVEASCTVEASVGQCLTPRVAVTHNNSVLMSSDCVRTDSNEPNPLVGVLDVTDGLLECLCYVIEINDIPTSNPTQCSLVVTRCKITT